MNETKEAFRLLVIQRPFQDNLPCNEESPERYTMIAMNRGESVEELVKWYDQRGECSENRTKELKSGYGIVATVDKRQAN